MMVKYYESEFDIPDILVEKYTKDFDGLPGSGQYEAVAQLRGSINEIVDIVAEEPEIIHEPEYLHDFIRALAMKQALQNHGILYDA
jgi:hypothetical protein